MPDSHFVAVVAGRKPIRVQPEGPPWLVIQNPIRELLRAEWDRVGVNSVVDDEYDMYIGYIHSLIRKGASPQKIAKFLAEIEHERMGLSPAPMRDLLQIATRLWALGLLELKKP